MSKVKVVADTETGEMTVEIDGATVANVRDVDFDYCPMEDGSSMCCVSIETFTMDENGARHYGRICANKSPEGKAAYYAGGLPSKYNGFINNPNAKDSKNKYSDAVQAIAKIREKK